eukprot:4448591-Lingulodinium_polyedra.AAC.1
MCRSFVAKRAMMAVSTISSLRSFEAKPLYQLRQHRKDGHFCCNDFPSRCSFATGKMTACSSTIA